MSLRALLAALLPLSFAFFLAAAPVAADSDSNSDSWDSDSWDSDSGSQGGGPAQAVPEPTAFLVFAAGAAGVAWTVRRRKNG